MLKTYKYAAVRVVTAWSQGLSVSRKSLHTPTPFGDFRYPMCAIRMRGASDRDRPEARLIVPPNGHLIPKRSNTDRYNGRFWFLRFSLRNVLAETRWDVSTVSWPMISRWGEGKGTKNKLPNLPVKVYNVKKYIQLVKSSTKHEIIVQHML